MHSSNLIYLGKSTLKNQSFCSKLVFQVDPSDNGVTYEIRHAAVDEAQLGLPEQFEGATFNVTTGKETSTDALVVS